MRAYLLLPVLTLLTACNWVMNVSGLAAESNKAIGASCRQTGRSLEECYRRNPEADKAQIYAGWREMHEYMAKNKLETVAPPPDPEPPVAAAPASAAVAHAPEPAQKKSEHPVAAEEEHAAASAPEKAAGGRRMLTDAEAEKMAKEDPLVDSILTTVRGAEKQEKGAKGEKGAPSSKDNRLLNILNEINAESAAAPAKPAGGH